MKIRYLHVRVQRLYKWVYAARPMSFSEFHVDYIP